MLFSSQVTTSGFSTSLSLLLSCFIHQFVVSLTSSPYALKDAKIRLVLWDEFSGSQEILMGGLKRIWQEAWDGRGMSGWVDIDLPEFTLKMALLSTLLPSLEKLCLSVIRQHR